jgi:hypothetical protein
MRKGRVFLAIFIFSSGILFAERPQIYIRDVGNASELEIFKQALSIEADAAGYKVAASMSEAQYSIVINMNYDSGRRLATTVSLVQLENDVTVVSMEYLFVDQGEMMTYAQLVFFLMVSNIPVDETMITAPENDDWRNKWLYIRASFDYSIAFLMLQNNDLLKGIAVHDGKGNGFPLDNKVVPIPGISLGAEVQFLDMMSAELLAQISYEEILYDKVIYNLDVGVQFKFPLKFFRNFLMEPYGALMVPLRFPVKEEIFNDLPLLIYGAGFQFGVKGGSNGSFFIDINFMYIGESNMKNLYTNYPKPEEIFYQHFMLGFGVGYKYGFFNRKKN